MTCRFEAARANVAYSALPRSGVSAIPSGQQNQAAGTHAGAVSAPGSVARAVPTASGAPETAHNTCCATSHATSHCARECEQGCADRRGRASAGAAP